jgi:hypothetical protein
LSLTACKEVPRAARDTSAVAGSTTTLATPAPPPVTTTATDVAVLPPRRDTTSPRTDDDTGAVVAPGPVVVAAFPVTQAEADSNEDIATALEDFQTYLPAIADSLRRLGVKFAVRFASPIRVTAGGQSMTWTVSDDSGGVGYLMLAPGKPPKAFWGVHTDLNDEARAYFAPAPDL